MKKIAICFLLLAGMVTVQANDMDAMKCFNLGLASSMTPTKIKHFSQALKLNPSLVDAYEKRGLLYFFQEKYDRVIQDFKKYVELAPTKPDGYRMLGVGYLKNGIYQPAIRNFTRTINMEPDRAGAYANRAEAYRLTGKYEEAIRDASRAIEIWGDPRAMSDAYKTRARAYRKIGKKTEAFADNKEAFNLDPSRPSFWDKPQPVGPMYVMGLFILNGIIFFFVFELKLQPLKFDITGRIRILNSKLLPPQSSDTISRKRLHAFYSEIPQKRITTVTAGAGYGKTTLIAHTGNHLNLNTIWYHLDKSDRDFAIFINYLVAGIQKYHPKFGIETCRRLSRTHFLSLKQEAVLAIFASELEKTVKENIIIVLDDYHMIQDSREIKETIEYFLKHFPQTVHMVIISRNDINLPLSRLRASRKVVDITKEDLEFTSGEIEQLYSQLFGIPLNQDCLGILHQKTAGWISGLILFYHSLKEKKPSEIETLLSSLNGSPKIIYSYLEENVYDMLTDEKKEFLIKTAIFPRMNPDFCDHFLNIHNSRDILKDLEQNHLFTFSIDEEDQWYAYHHLFQEFLQRKLRSKLGLRAMLELYRNASLLLENNGKNEALPSLCFKAETFQKTCNLLSGINLETGNESMLWQKYNRTMIRVAASDLSKKRPQKSPPGLKVHFFGRLRVFQGGVEIPDSRWKSKKAQMIFKYLIYSRPKGYLKKDVLMELLWPEEDPKKTVKRLHVALASLRKTLEPEISRRTPSAYIIRSGDGYRIDIGDDGWIDIENFKAELKLAGEHQNSEMSIVHYLNAVSIYQGDFLEEDLYISWCDEERDRFRGEYLQLLEGIIEYYHFEKDYKKCIGYVKKYLQVDKFAEDVYQLLMTYYSKIGNKSAVVRTFKKCKESITKGLDCPLSKETETLYQNLVSK